jgi:hypothetical protein
MAGQTNQVIYKDKSIKIIEDSSTDILKAKRAWNDVFQAKKNNNCQPRLLYPVTLS